jgi:hypothetical protein
LLRIESAFEEQPIQEGDMTTRLLGVIETIRAVRRDTRAWVNHLTGEGPATLRRQRESLAQAMAAAPPAPSTRRTPALAKRGLRRAPGRLTTRRRQPVLGVR